MKIISLGIFLIEERGLMILYLKQFVYFCLIDSSKTEREREKKKIYSEVELFALQILAIAFGILVSFLSVCLVIIFSIYFLMVSWPSQSYFARKHP